MILEALDLTGSGNIFYQKHAFIVAGEANKNDPAKPPIKIELYPTFRGLPSMVLSTPKVEQWQSESGVQTHRIHLPFLYNPQEVIQQALVGDWYTGPKHYVMHQAMMFAVGSMSNMFAVNLAQELGVGANAHPNVIAGLARDSLLPVVKSKLLFLLGENSVSYNSNVLDDREALGDPIATVEKIVEPHELDGLLLAIDHLFGLDAKKAQVPGYVTKRVLEIITLIHHPKVLEHTKAMHLALPGYNIIPIGDPHMETIFYEMAGADFKHPVRLALDMHPLEVRKMSYPEQIKYVTDFRAWVFSIFKY